MTGYVTRDKDGLLLLHYHYPVRNTDEGIWVSDGNKMVSGNVLTLFILPYLVAKPT